MTILHYDAIFFSSFSGVFEDYNHSVITTKKINNFLIEDLKEKQKQTFFLGKHVDIHHSSLEDDVNICTFSFVVHFNSLKEAIQEISLINEKIIKFLNI